MKTLIFIMISIVAITILYFKRNSVALWTADPFGSCQVENLRYEESDFHLKYSTYTHKSNPFLKTLLVLPPTGGKNILDEGYALSLCRAGYKVYILEDWKNIKDYELDYKIHQTYQTRTQRAFRKIIELMEGDEIGVLGTSAGGINFSVSLGTDEVAKKVKAFFSIVAGHPLCKVIATSHETGLKKIRELRFEKTDVADMDQYTKNLCSALSWKSAEELPDEMAYGAIISMNDVTVSTDYQLEMVKSYKPKVLIKSNFNHFYTVVSSYFLHKNKIVDFFKTNL